MASFKADGRYVGRADDCTDDSHLSDQQSADELDVPWHLLRERWHWRVHYQNEVESLFSIFIEEGSAIFGGAFHQLGTVDHFANFVFKYMQPGAN